MSFFARLFGLPNTQQDSGNFTINECAASTLDPNNPNNTEIVAVITAALMNILSEENNGQLRIKSIRRTGRSSPVWNLAGRSQYIESKL